MILTVAAFLTTLGFIAFLLGNVFGMKGVAVIGGTIIVGVGAMTTANGLSYKTGETHTTAGNDGVTEVENEYEPVNTPTRLPLGTLVMLLGAALVLHSLDET